MYANRQLSDTPLPQVVQTAAGLGVQRAIAEPLDAPARGVRPLATVAHHCPGTAPTSESA